MEGIKKKYKTKKVNIIKLADFYNKINKKKNGKRNIQ
jgi:hypothetical protein|tara:strand:- start:24 stop:134 length:111 start_codon:yes stop_codon:yes gene_type:complete